MTKFNARQLRKNMTDAEKILWRHLRLKQMESYKFRRQCPIGSYIVDFVCFKRKLIIELDGSQHLDQIIYDEKRTKWFEGEGFRILRFWNSQVLNNTESVLNTILNSLTPTLVLPHKGGGERVLIAALPSAARNDSARNPHKGGGKRVLIAALHSVARNDNAGNSLKGGGERVL